jgi:choline-sulfatase
MSKRPDILFIFSDQHAQRVAGCYGDDVARTPALDRLAREGVTFDACYAPSPVCGPSRMSMLTARTPSSIGCWTNNDILPSDTPTYAHALSASGYDTISMGRLHVLGPDQHRGFGARLIGDHSPNWPGVARHDMGILSKTHGPNRISVERSGRGNSAYQNLDEATLDATLAQLSAIAERRLAGETQPFFMQVGFMLPHPPYVARPKDYDLFEGKVPPARLPPPEAPHPWMDWWRGNRQIETVTGAEAERSRTAYYALVHRLDLHVGMVLERLAELGLEENTLVVYASDHGDHLAERGLWWKHTMYDESVKVPLIMRWPAVLPKSARRPEAVSLLDVAATFTDVAGAPGLPNSGARSLLALSCGDAPDWDETVYSEYCASPDEPYSGGRWTLQRMVRSGRWKYVHHDGFPDQLFDLAADPDEVRNLAAEPDHREILSSLRDKALADWDAESIRARMARRARDRAVMQAWAIATQPQDVLRWHFEPEINRLDDAASLSDGAGA